MYDEYRAGFQAPLDDLSRRCVEILGHHYQPTSRLKTLDSAVAKLRRGFSRLSRVQDIAGLRIEAADLGDQDRVVAELVRAFPVARVTDYRESPQNGYRAVHVIVRTPENLLAEIQVRSFLQNAWANVSERVAYRFGMALKYGSGSTDLGEQLTTLSAHTHAAEGALRMLSKATSADDIDALSVRAAELVNLVWDEIGEWFAILEAEPTQ